MKKLITFIVLLSVASGCHAGLVNWYADNLDSDPVGATFEGGWIVALYQDVNGDNNGSATWYNDLRLDQDGLTTSSGVTAEDALLAYATTIIKDVGLITFDPKFSTDITPDDADVYTVIFSAADIGSAGSFVVADASTFNVGAVNAPDTPKDYVISSIAGTVQAIPEPAVVSFIAIFGGGLLFARRIFKKA